jgi:hypothetical protein
MNNFRKQEPLDVEALHQQVAEGDAIEQMVASDGWQLLSNLLRDQLEAYKAELLVGCKDWNEYLDKRAKAHAISLLLVDVEDYIQRGRDAKQQLNV